MQIELLHIYTYCILQILWQEKKLFLPYFIELQVLYQCQLLHKIIICF